MNVLVTGGAGFIGSTTSELLLSDGHDVTVIDDLSSGLRDNVPHKATFVGGSVGDYKLVHSLGHFDACLHFAGKIAPGESMSSPEVFFTNNVAQSFELLRALIDNGVGRFVFSSSCAVYGDDVTVPIDESHPTRPHSPYGESKLMVEQGLRWLSERGRLSTCALRYFNAAGGTVAHPERHDPEIHLIPLALAAAAGDRPGIDLYGDDYPTRDGTCVRDYIHVVDLARAHILALAALEKQQHLTLNLGTGIGCTNREILNTVREVTGQEFDIRVAARRPGDPAEAVASNQRARATLGWDLEYSNLERLVSDAWAAYQVMGD